MVRSEIVTAIVLRLMNSNNNFHHPWIPSGLPRVTSVHFWIWVFSYFVQLIHSWLKVTNISLYINHPEIIKHPWYTTWPWHSVTTLYLIRLVPPLWIDIKIKLGVFTECHGHVVYQPWLKQTELCITFTICFLQDEVWLHHTPTYTDHNSHVV